MADNDRAPVSIQELLSDTYTPEGVTIWWNGRNKNLAGVSPREVWSWGINGPLDVLDEINRIRGGFSG